MLFSASVAPSGRVEGTRGRPLSDQDMRPGVRQRRIQTKRLTPPLFPATKLEALKAGGQGKFLARQHSLAHSQDHPYATRCATSWSPNRRCICP
jgi:hypothetical protein